MQHKATMNTILDVNERFNIQPSDCVLALSRLNFDLSVYDIFGMLSAGGTIVLPDEEEQKDPFAWYNLLQRESVTVWNTVPALMEMLVSYIHGKGERLPSSLRLILMSGDWIPTYLPDVIRKDLPGVEVVSLGGATEAAIWSILYPIHEVNSDWNSIPYGMAMRNQEFYVLDNEMCIRDRVGMACRFPGGCNSPDQLWEFLSQGRDGITEVPENRWDAQAYYDPNPKAQGKATTCFGGFLENIEMFDAAHFGITPREAKAMDVQLVSYTHLQRTGFEAL